MMRKKHLKSKIMRNELLAAIANPNTRRNYQSLLAQLDSCFEPFTGKEPSLGLMQFIRCEQDRGISPQTLKQKVSILSSIIEKAKASGIRTDNPVQKSWAPKVKIATKPRCPTLDELRNLKLTIAEQKGFLGARDKAIVTLMYAEGLRVHEVSNIDHEDIDSNGANMTLTVCGKGGYKTSIELYPQTKLALSNYKRFIPNEYRTGPYFIPSFELGKRLDIRSIRKRCNYLFEKSGWRKGLSCHSLRHAMSVTLLENGLPLTEIQRKLRHRYLSSSYSYYSDVKSLRNTEKLQYAHKFLVAL